MSEREHRDGCLTEHTWDESDCNCRTCPVCGNAVRADGSCRWAPHASTAEAGRGADGEFATQRAGEQADGGGL